MDLGLGKYWQFFDWESVQYMDPKLSKENPCLAETHQFKNVCSIDRAKGITHLLIGVWHC